MRFCGSQVQTPFATAIHLFVGLFVAASYIPQLIQIATNDHTGNAGISGWYIILLTTSASSHLASRIKNINSGFTWRCFRDGDLQGFDPFFALVVYLQAFIHWAAAIALLAVYVSFRTRTTPGNEAHATIPSPSNPVILAIVLIHAAIILPPALYLLELITQERHEDDAVLFVKNSIYGILLRITGIFTSLTAAIPQIHLMVTRSRINNLDQGSLSLLSLGLQIIAFTALAGSQGWRMRLPPPPPDALDAAPESVTWSVEWWAIIFVFSGLGALWVTLAVSQLLVLCVALGLGAGEGRIHL
ncbi:hypothetical protein BDW59DRAFT_160887 [Aspergillus cavernicola]|uniref:Uncharacterized protein n=1 Tax=Aspergillus cavernicola TaxID=176166 RepID=A0ABR4IG04_9EURO